ncbi:hypothetical protein E2C01_028089 [Portunus trituberculatus]|uniref:Uncharacterized protein n=1 Tax=Portunus trituberculatus TaxID=210409 RepID=A0A5B7EJL3_PORTR|nr:hypothetical protein [Portunus trituberculatus]
MNGYQNGIQCLKATTYRGEVFEQPSPVPRTSHYLTLLTAHRSSPTAPPDANTSLLVHLLAGGRPRHLNCARVTTLPCSSAVQ